MIGSRSGIGNRSGDSIDPHGYLDRMERTSRLRLARHGEAALGSARVAVGFDAAHPGEPGSIRAPQDLLRSRVRRHPIKTLAGALAAGLFGGFALGGVKLPHRERRSAVDARQTDERSGLVRLISLNRLLWLARLASSANHLTRTWMQHATANATQAEPDLDEVVP